REELFGIRVVKLTGAEIDRAVPAVERGQIRVEVVMIDSDSWDRSGEAHGRYEPSRRFALRCPSHERFPLITARIGDASPEAARYILRELEHPDAVNVDPPPCSVPCEPPAPRRHISELLTMGGD